MPSGSWSGSSGMQATPDILLGWTRGPGGRDFYLRQLWDMKGSVDITTIEPVGLGFYGGSAVGHSRGPTP